jgi:hypothetical protein
MPPYRPECGLQLMRDRFVIPTQITFIRHDLHTLEPVIIVSGARQSLDLEAGTENHVLQSCLHIVQAPGAS